MWKKLSSKQIFSHPRLTVIEDEVELPSGHRTKYLQYENTGSSSATVLCLREDHKILVQTEYHYPVGKELYQFPGGCVEENEKPEDGANREITEEAGLFAKELTQIGSYWIHARRTTKQCHIFIAQNFEKLQAKADETEELKSMWLSIEEIDSLIASGEILNGHFLSAWALFKNHLAHD